MGRNELFIYMHKINLDEQTDLSDDEALSATLPVDWYHIDAKLGTYLRIARYDEYKIGDTMIHGDEPYIIKGFAKHHLSDENQVISDPVIVVHTDQFINLRHLDEWTHVPA